MPVRDEETAQPEARAVARTTTGAAMKQTVPPGHIQIPRLNTPRGHSEHRIATFTAHNNRTERLRGQGYPAPVAILRLIKSEPHTSRFSTTEALRSAITSFGSR